MQQWARLSAQTTKGVGWEGDAERVPRAQCAQCAEVRLAQNGVTMECCPKAVTGAVASQMGGQLLCFGGINNVGVYEWAAGHLVHWKLSV